jgi:hypothetical protein
MSKPIGLMQRLSVSYKNLKLPWKKNVLVGTDLDGNEYWEMPSPLGNGQRKTNGSCTRIHTIVLLRGSI